MPGDRAPQAWDAARRAAPRAKRWPVLLGNDDNLARIREGLEAGCESSSPERELRVAETLDPAELQARWRRSTGIKPRELEADTPLPRSIESGDELTTHIDVTTNRPYPRVWMALLPTSEAARAPALLMFGGWNENPRAAAHVAMHRAWHDRYGSEIVAVSDEVIETRVPRRPGDDQRAIAIAREQFVYAPDIVWQGTDDLAGLAAALRNSRIWYFWWD